jgi:hypothetical protein
VFGRRTDWPSGVSFNTPSPPFSSLLTLHVGVAVVSCRSLRCFFPYLAHLSHTCSRIATHIQTHTVVHQQQKREAQPIPQQNKQKHANTHASRCRTECGGFVPVYWMRPLQPSLLRCPPLRFVGSNDTRPAHSVPASAQQVGAHSEERLRQQHLKRTIPRRRGTQPLRGCLRLQLPLHHHRHPQRSRYRHGSLSTPRGSVTQHRGAASPLRTS